MKKTLLILGAGTGGTIIANKMVRRLDPRSPLRWHLPLPTRREPFSFSLRRRSFGQFRLGLRVRTWHCPTGRRSSMPRSMLSLAIVLPPACAT